MTVTVVYSLPVVTVVQEVNSVTPVSSKRASVLSEHTVTVVGG